ncbi:MAG: helix-turn-helix domain-containing protein [Gaiellaceae bacterium]
MSKKASRRRFSQKPFGETVEKLMSDTGATYRALAEKTHLSAGYLNHIVHGNRPVPSDSVIASIGKALGVEADFFREYRIRQVTERLENDSALTDRLYRRL